MAQSKKIVKKSVKNSTPKKILAKRTRPIPTKEWRSLEYTIEIPQGTEVKYEFPNIIVKGQKGEITRKLRYPNVELVVEGSQVKITTSRFTQKLKKIMSTYRAHINNMITGVNDGFEYKLKVVYAKFPMTVELKDSTLIVKNFLGEKVPRVVKIPVVDGLKVEVKAEDITVTGIDKELCGKIAALIEQSTRITHLDRRVIQDGIYITNKPHRAYV
ncbi:MAG: 50S ribosomal protein L6 [Nanoarchaeota archaeon]|nr:50S ribosomal protein L6 [Nanoarchaeota archaeon]